MSHFQRDHVVRSILDNWATLGLALLLSLASFPTPRLLSEEWPTFQKDAFRTGWSVEDVGSGLKEAWKVDLGAPIYSSPVISGGVLYVGTTDNRLAALDTRDGSLLWQTSALNWIESTPAVAGGAVYAGSMDKRVYALDALTGDLLWTCPTGSWVESSPLVHGERVYIGSWEGIFYALDAATGAVSWNYNAGEGICSSAAISDSLGLVYFGADNDSLYALDLSGKRAWAAYTNGAPYSSPTFRGDRIVLGTIDNGEGNFANQVLALDAATGAQLWNRPFGQYQYVYASPAVEGDRVVVVTYQGDVYALDLSDGSLAWSKSLNDYILHGSPAVADGILYAASYDGSLYAVSTLTGRVIASYATSLFLTSSPAVSDGRAYIAGSDGWVYCLDVTTPVEVEVTSSAGEVHPGDTLTFTVQLTNVSGTAQDFGAWLVFETPGVSERVLSRRDGLHLEAGQQITASDLSLEIPPGMAPGDYALTVRAGELPADEWDTGGIGFTVVAR
jgi:outer membrane protein assembly factor BamB